MSCGPSPRRNHAVTPTSILPRRQKTVFRTDSTPRDFGTVLESAPASANKLKETPTRGEYFFATVPLRSDLTVAHAPQALFQFGKRGELTSDAFDRDNSESLDEPTLPANIRAEDRVFSFPFEAHATSVAGARLVLYSIAEQTGAPFTSLSVSLEADRSEDVSAFVADFSDEGTVLRGSERPCSSVSWHTSLPRIPHAAIFIRNSTTRRNRDVGCRRVPRHHVSRCCPASTHPDAPLPETASSSQCRFHVTPILRRLASA
jgi:hypothetical protein